MKIKPTGERTCMDCGKAFTVTTDQHGKLEGCWYWGILNPSKKYQYFLGGSMDTWDWDKNQSWWRKLLKEYIPCYHHGYEEATIRPIWKRWWLKIREQWALLTDPIYRKLSKAEMWSCHECVIESKKHQNQNL